MGNDVLKMHADDSVGIALRDLAAGELATPDVKCLGAVPTGHKVALQAIEAGEAVRKYGHVIGVARRDLAAGEHVHSHNLGYSSDAAAPARHTAGGRLSRSDTSSGVPAKFLGYRRANGKVGTRNFVGVMATVNCSATVVARIARHFETSRELDESNVDGVVPIAHQSGCGIPASHGVELGLLQQVLRGYLDHPNFCGWLVVGLGCEVNQASQLLGAAGGDVPTVSLNIQEAGGTTAAISAGIGQVRDLIAESAGLTRSEAPLSALTLGLQCGGSDAWSGVTANPALGNAVDRLVARGGSAILAETPELHGAEELLKDRAIDAGVAAALQRKVDWWHDYLAAHHQNVDSNPSPGNLAGGITTILEKSLGAVAKGGSTPLAGVLDYAERLRGQGLWFMDSPGYDPCSVTGEVAAGANVVCFTTGRGSTFGAAGAPTLKLASNSRLFSRMRDDMDVDCGGIADGRDSIERVGERIARAVVDAASGKRTSSERHGLGTFEFVPWTPGAVV